MGRACSRPPVPPLPAPVRACPICGADVSRRGEKAVYCSKRCRQTRNSQAWKARIRQTLAPITCQGCQVVFRPCVRHQRFCSPDCSNRYHHQQRVRRAAARQQAAEDARASAPESARTIEAAIARHLARIKASGQFRLTDEVIWSRRVDLLAEQAQDMSGLWRLSPCTSKKRREGRDAQKGAA